MEDERTWKEKVNGVKGYSTENPNNLAKALYSNLPKEYKGYAPALLLAWNYSLLDPFPDEVIQSANLLSMREFESHKSNIFKPISFSEFGKMEFPDIEWRIKNLIPKEGITSLSSPSGVAKTWMALSLSLSIANGDNFLEKQEFSSTKGKVLYLDAEMGLRAIQKRCFQLGYKGLKDQDNFFILNTYDFNFKTEGSIQILEDFIDEKNIDVIVIDTFRPFSAGTDENSGGEVREFFQSFYKLRDKGLSVIILDHHRKKAQMESARPTKEKLIGSQDKMASVDVALMLHQDTKNKIIEVHQVKNRFLEEAEPFGFKMIDSIDEKFNKITKLEFTVISTEEESKVEQAEELIFEILSNEKTKTRKELLELLKEASIGESNADKARKNMIQSEIVGERKNGRQSEYYLIEKDELIESVLENFN